MFSNVAVELFNDMFSENYDTMIPHNYVYETITAYKHFCKHNRKIQSETMESYVALNRKYLPGT
jgi:hypothetical protein